MTDLKRPLKPDGCRCPGNTHVNPYCFITSPPTVTIGALLTKMGFPHDDDGVRAALEELLRYLDEGRTR